MSTIITEGDPLFDPLVGEYIASGLGRVITYNYLRYLPYRDSEGNVSFILLEENNPLYDDPASPQWSQYYGYKTRNTIKPR
jgi:hypothetical protein